MHRGPDTSLIEAAREMAPIVREHSAQARAGTTPVPARS